MSKREEKPLLAPAVTLGLVLVSALSFIAFLALSAYAPEFRDDRDGGGDALSKSAIGFAGLRILLDASDVPNVVDRGQATGSEATRSLLVLTPAYTSARKDVNELAFPGPSLIVLPKWMPMPDPKAYGRVLKAHRVETAAVEKLLDLFSKGTRITRRSDTIAPSLAAVGNIAISLSRDFDRVDSLQTLSGQGWVPIVADRRGGAVLARFLNDNVYALSDPDLMNNHGLRDPAASAFSIAVIQRLRTGSAPVAFDVSLNGLGQTPSLLRAIFAPPFLGATLCALLAAALVGFHAAVRFGSPPAMAPRFGRGKQALTDNAADLIRMLHREPNMAARYALTTKSLVLRALGIRPQMDLRSDDATLNVLEHEGGTTYAALLDKAMNVTNRSDLVTVARSLYEWRQGMVHGRE